MQSLRIISNHLKISLIISLTMTIITTS